MQLTAEVAEHEKILAQLTKQVAPKPVAAHGIGPDTASEMLIVAGDNAARVQRARLGSAARRRPDSSLFGLTNRHRLDMATTTGQPRALRAGSYRCSPTNPSRPT